MARSDWNYVPGDHWLICDVCSKKIKASESRTRWDGLQTCKDDWEERQPQDFVKAKTDKIAVPIVRPVPGYIFTNITYVDTQNTTIPTGNNHGEL